MLCFSVTGSTHSAVVRDCNTSITVLIGEAPVNVTGHCVNDLFNYYYERLQITLEVNATVCPCTTQHCNSGGSTPGKTVNNGPSVQGARDGSKSAQCAHHGEFTVISVLFLLLLIVRCKCM